MRSTDVECVVIIVETVAKTAVGSSDIWNSP
jgi:hypothetical protein